MIINLLLQDKFLISLIDPKPSKCELLDVNDVLLGGQWTFNDKKYNEQGYIFDYNFVDNTTIDEKTFIFVDVNIDAVDKNMFADFDLYVCVFTDKKLVRITSKTVPSVSDIQNRGYYASTYGNRIDIMCDVIDRILNGYNKTPAIGDIQPSSRGYLTNYSPNKNYYGKCLKYHVKNYNDGGGNCGNK